MNGKTGTTVRLFNILSGVGLIGTGAVTGFFDTLGKSQWFSVVITIIGFVQSLVVDYLHNNQGQAQQIQQAAAPVVQEVQQALG